MISTIQSITTKSIIKNLFKIKEDGLKYCVNLTFGNSPSEYTLIETEDIFSKNKYLAKLVYSDSFTSIYTTIPYPLKERTGEKILKNKVLIKELFDNPDDRITIKYNTEDMYTEYLSIEVNEIFKKIGLDKLNKYKPLIFSKLYDIDDFIPLMECPNGNYVLVAKK